MITDEQEGLVLKAYDEAKAALDALHKHYNFGAGAEQHDAKLLEILTNMLLRSFGKEKT